MTLTREFSCQLEEVVEWAHIISPRLHAVMERTLARLNFAELGQTQLCPSGPGELLQIPTAVRMYSKKSAPTTTR